MEEIQQRQEMLSKIHNNIADNTGVNGRTWSASFNYENKALITWMD